MAADRLAAPSLGRHWGKDLARASRSVQDLPPNSREFRMQKEAAARKDWFRPRSLFGKYVTSFVEVVVLVLAVNGGLETWFTYRQTTELLAKAQSEKAEATARRIEQSVSEIERQISWATRASATTLDQRRSDYALLLQQVPAVDRVIQLDGTGKELLRLTRSEVVIASDIDYSGDPRSKAVQGRSVWFSPVYFDGPDPFMSIAMPHSGRDAGSTVAEINLKFLSSFIDPEQIGTDNAAFVVGPSGRLLAHSAALPRLCAAPAGPSHAAPARR